MSQPDAEQSSIEPSVVANIDRRRFLTWLGSAAAVPAVTAIATACGGDSATTDTTATDAATTTSVSTTTPAAGATTTAASTSTMASTTATTAAAATTTGKPTPTTTKPTSATTTNASTTTANTAPTTTTTARGPKPIRKVKLGFIALTDAAPIIMAKELRYFTERDLDVDVLKQASWPATRDALLNNQIDGAHALYSMPYSVASKIGGNGSTDLRIAMILNNNGQAITLHKDYAEVGYGDLGKAKELLTSSSAPDMAMTFPGGTHDLWLRYWLAACGVNANAVKITALPPPTMVQNMTAGNVRGYCVGEPWNAAAASRGIGFTTLATQSLWLHHPEKALVVGSKFANEQTDTLRDVMAAVLKACKWLDEPANRSKAADTLGQEQYVNAKPDDIRGRLTGVYDLGADLGQIDFVGEQMQFFRGGQANFPRRAHGIWALAQFQRLGLTKDTPDYRKLVDTIVLSDLYASVASQEGIAVPNDDMTPFKVKLDNATFDPTKPDAEVKRPAALA